MSYQTIRAMQTQLRLYEKFIDMKGESSDWLNEVMKETRSFMLKRLLAAQLKEFKK